MNLRVVLAALLLTSAAGACGGHHDATVDAPDGDAPSDGPPIPKDLVETGLCSDAACTQINPGIVEYAPRFTLWADTASKRRWMYLPPGTQIDTSDMNHWAFPTGFKAWKEFTRDGVRVETRMLEKVGPGNTENDWLYIGFQWTPTEDGTMAVPHGASGVNGTGHHIPSQEECQTCHEQLAPSRVLGIQAVQLDGATPVGVDELAAMNVLTAPPTGASPHFPIPGKDATEQMAIGYLHGNCGHCHNPLSVVQVDTPIELRLDIDHMATTADTSVYTTVVDKNTTKPFSDATTLYTKLIVSGDADHSAVIGRFISEDLKYHMPGGSMLTDGDGLTLLRTWIDSL